MLNQQALEGFFDSVSIFGGLWLLVVTTNIYPKILAFIIMLGGSYRGATRRALHEQRENNER